MKGFAYIMTNSANKVLYTGVTRDLVNRVDQHKTKKHPGSFSATYNVSKLVYFEEFETLVEARQRRSKPTALAGTK
jgi:putative endonuclease